MIKNALVIAYLILYNNIADLEKADFCRTVFFRQVCLSRKNAHQHNILCFLKKSTISIDNGRKMVYNNTVI